MRTVRSLIVVVCVVVPVLLTAGSSHAQVVFSEDWGAATTTTTTPTSLPAGWTVIDVDGLTHDPNAAEWTEAWMIRDDFNDPSNVVAYSSSWYSPPGTSDDWAITPSISLPANAKLTWRDYSQDANFLETIQVRLSTTTPTVVGMTTTLTTHTAAATWTLREVDLSSWAGQAVYIGFRNISNDKFLLGIDDIQVASGVSKDIAITSSAMPSYYSMVPRHQMFPLTLSADIRNVGVDTLTGAAVSATVQLDGNGIYGSLSTIGTLGASLTDTAAFIPYVPMANGAITVTYSATHDDPDGDPTNDTLAVGSFLVNDSWLGRDDNTVTGALGIGAGNGGEMGTTITINKATELTNIWAFVTGAVVTETFSAKVRALDGVDGRPGTEIGSSTPFTPSIAGGQAVTFTFAANVPLTPGSYYIGVTESDAPAHSQTLAYADGILQPGTQWVNWPTIPQGDWTNVEVFGIDKTYFLRAFLIEPGLPFSDGFESNDTSGWTNAVP